MRLELRAADDNRIVGGRRHDRRRGSKPGIAAPRLGEAQAVFLALLGVGVLGWLDWITGPNLAFSVFYLVPVAVVSRSFPGRSGILLAAAAAAMWVLADVAAAPPYSTAFIPLWNSMTRFVVFAVVSGLVTRLQRSVRHEQELARIDHLTGTANSRWFAEAARHAMENLHTGAASLVFLDLDDFKAINDRQGHGGGDEVLRKVGAALKAAVRESDLVGRLGGDEFAVLLIRPSEQDAEIDVERVVERVRAALGALDPPVSFSAGAVTFEPPPRSITIAIDAADALMYRVKRQGKGALEVERFRHT